MTISMRAMGGSVFSLALLSGCVSDGAKPPAGEEEVDPAPGVSVVVPAERLTPFCQAMTDLTDRLRSNEPVGDDEIVETYRSISATVPAEIADDFALVLEALESGAPSPTDPPRGTIETVPRPSAPTSDATPPTTATTETTLDTNAGSTAPGSSPATSVVVDERFDRDGSPAERLNSYVSFTCRDSDNNPGPPATQPLEDPPTSDDN